MGILGSEDGTAFCCGNIGRLPGGGGEADPGEGSAGGPGTGARVGSAPGEPARREGLLCHEQRGSSVMKARGALEQASQGTRRLSADAAVAANHGRNVPGAQSGKDSRPAPWPDARPTPTGPGDFGLLTHGPCTSVSLQVKRVPSAPPHPLRAAGRLGARSFAESSARVEGVHRGVLAPTVLL